MTAPALRLDGLLVRTARLSYSGPGRLDITAKSKDPIGSAFAPSWGILEPALAARKTAEALIAAAERDAHEAIIAQRSREAPFILACAREGAALYQLAAWERYVPLYLTELERSKVDRADAWEWLQRRAVECALVVGVCFCAGEEARLGHCHRFLWARHLEGLGATYEGEAPEGRRAAA